MAHLSSFERDVVYSSLLTQDERHCLPWEAGTFRNVVFPTRSFVAIKDIATARDKLVAHGVFLHKATTRREWIEINPDYRHAQGQNETSYGDETPPAEQRELSLIVEASRPEPKIIPPRNHNRLRVEKEQKRNSESTPPRPYESTYAPQPSPDSATRDLSFPKDETRFARGPENLPDDPLWQRLCKILGGREMILNGASWLKRHKLCYDALSAAVSDWLAMPPAMQKDWNPAAYLTTAFENEKRKFGT